MKKRGQLLTLWMLVSIIGAVLIAYTLANIGSQRATGEVFFKSRVAKDIALEINSLYSVQGDAYIINDNNYSYSFEFKDNKVRVFKDKLGLFSASSYDFVKSGQEDIDYKFEHPKQLVISKINSKITITEEIPDFFRGVMKKEPDFKNMKILVYYDINNNQSGELVSSIIILENNKKIFPHLYSGYTQDKIESSDVIIGIYSKEGQGVSFYVNKKSLNIRESLSLANALKIKVKDIINANEPTYLEVIDEDKKHILDNDKIAIYVELPKTGKISEIANVVYDSLELYSK